MVEGDVMLKEFNFIVDNKIDKPVKIGRVGHAMLSKEITILILSLQAVHDITELKDEKINNKVEPDTINQNNYWLQAGRNIDLAFLVLACHGMDMMFYDESYDWNVQQKKQKQQ